MTFTKRRTLFLFTALLVCLSSYSQKLKYQFGEIDLLDLSMERYIMDSSIGALKLLSYGHTYYDEDQKRMKQIVDQRIKIFTTDGFNYADFVLRFPSEVRVSKFRASVYNLSSGGQIEETKVDSDALIKERINEEVRSLKLAFPNVKTGSIIEYSYTVNTQLQVTIFPWYFQEFIPVRHSEYLVEYPEFAGYEVLIQRGQLINYVSEPKKGQQLYLAKNLPPMPREKYVGDLNDYRCAVLHEVKILKDYRKGGSYTRVFEDWSGVNADLMLHDDFGERLRQGKVLKKQLPSFTRGLSPWEKVNLIRRAVMNKVRWNKKESLIASSSLKNTWDKGIGEAQDINLTLVAMLKAAGFEADPVIISTRDNGLLDLEHPFVNQFNYVLAHVEIEGKELLLDAVYKDYPMGLLPGRLINKRGLMVTKGTPRWIDLNLNGEKEILLYSAVLNFDEDMNLSGELTITVDGLSAQLIRRDLAGKNKEEQLLYLKNRYANLSIKSAALEETLPSVKPLRIKLSFEKEVEEAYAQNIFINPLVFQTTLDNPFKDKERYAPVHFNVPAIRKWVYTINFPSSMVLEELPEAQVIRLPDNGARFVYNVSGNDNTVTAIVNYNLEKTFYPVDEYPSLRDFFERVVRAQESMFHIRHQ